MLVIRQRGNGADYEPRLLCTLCKKPMELQVAWLAFTPVTEDEPQSAGVWIHRPCLNGHALSMFRTPRLVLWRGVDLLSRLLRATEIPDRPGHR